MQSFVFDEITEENGNDCINIIRANSAHDMDEIHAKFVKMSHCILSLILAKLFNK